jgi:hypothetical protein
MPRSNKDEMANLCTSETSYINLKGAFNFILSHSDNKEMSKFFTKGATVLSFSSILWQRTIEI